MRLRAVLATLGLVAGCGGPAYQGPVGPHFDGARFHNDPPVHTVDLGDLLRWEIHADPTPWPDFVDWADGQGPTVPAPSVTGGEVRVTFVGHATFLVQMDGVNVLTDPVWSDRVGPTSWLGPKRHHAPGVRFEDLPPIDLVVVSHDHFDHMDLPTLRRLSARDAPLVLSGLGNGPLLDDAAVAPHRELDWWECTRVKALRVCGVPAQHDSRRGLFDGARTLWGGYWIEGPSASLFFAGDTGFGPHFAAIRARMGAPCVAILPIGAYRPRWALRNNHMDPSDAVQAHDILGAKLSIAGHFATFRQSDEGMYQPAGELGLALARGGARHAPFVAPSFGEARDIRCVPRPHRR